MRALLRGLRLSKSMVPLSNCFRYSSRIVSKIALLQKYQCKTNIGHTTLAKKISPISGKVYKTNPSLRATVSSRL